MSGINDSMGIDTSAPRVMYQDEEHKKQQKEEARELRMSRCGQYGPLRLNPLTHEWFGYKLRCGYWRECPICFSSRVKVFQERFNRAQRETDHNVAVIQCNNKTCQGLIRKFRKAGTEYWRIPHAMNEDERDEPDAEKFYFLLWDNSSSWDIVTELDVDELDMRLLASTPLGCRYSGSLGKPPQEETDKDEHAILVTVPDLYVAMPPGVETTSIIQKANKIMQERELQVTEFNEQALNFSAYLCGEIMKKLIEEAGGTYEDGVAKIRVSFSMYEQYIMTLKKDEPKPVVDEHPLEKEKQLTFNQAMDDLFEF